MNPDAIAISAPRTQPPVSWIEKKLGSPDVAGAYRNKVDMTMHTGTKAVDSNGLKRMLEFNQWLFSTEADVVVAVGHSLWFKSFFNEFLPRADDNKVKKNKLPNCGVVEFVIESINVDNEVESRPAYYIQPQSIKILKQ